MSSTHGNGPALDPKIYCHGLKNFAPMAHVAIGPIVLAMRWARASRQSRQSRRRTW